MPATLTRTILHRDDGLASTGDPTIVLADLELKVIERYFGAGDTLLDLGCGGGRVAVYFSLKGPRVVGVDIDMASIEKAKALKKESYGDSDFVLADARRLCFRSESFDYVLSFASMLSEKHNLWMTKSDRADISTEAIRVAKSDGLVLFSFVYRYWNLRGFLAFFKHYWMWVREKVAGERTELGDYVELLDGTRVRFHAFTLREARVLFPKNTVNMEVWKTTKGPFTDWFFIAGRKTAA